MALTVTSLNGNVGLNDTFVKLTAHTVPTAGRVGPVELLLVDGEYMQVTDTTLTPTVQVARGMNGSAACAHKTLAPVTYGLASDFTQTISTDGRSGSAQLSLAVNDTNVTLPTVDATIYITKAGVLAITINGPNKDQTNTIRLVSLTANAHLITYTAGWYANTTSSDVATFPATAGAVFTFVARNGLWNAVATADDGVLIG